MSDKFYFIKGSIENTDTIVSLRLALLKELGEVNFNKKGR